MKIQPQPLDQYEKWFTAHRKKKLKQKTPESPKTVAVLPDNVIYVDFKTHKRIK